MMPAAFTTTCSAERLLTSLSTAAVSVTSRIFVSIGAGKLSSDAKPRASTSAPASENAWAIARPMPLVPPVTSTRLPWKLNISYSMYP